MKRKPAAPAIGKRPRELRYGRLSQIEKDIQAAEQELEAVKENALLKEEIGEDDIARIVAKWTGIPVTRMMEGEIQKLVQMPERLKDRVVGQDEAVRLVSNAILRNRAGLSDPNRPIGSFIFLGPTGVGKTELVRALAHYLFDDDKAMIRVDMSEYMEKHAVARMIGSPPGYVGYEEGGQLTEQVRRRPYSVVLFDEIEKAHPDVFNMLLQILDDGRLTDGQGRTVSFKNTVIVMTSNVGTGMVEKNAIGFSVHGKDARNDDTRKRLLDALRQQFRPEFLNRIDDIIVFNSLTREHLVQIVDIQFATVAQAAQGPQNETGSDGRRQRPDHLRRLRSAIRRAPHAPRHPAPDPGSAGAQAAQRRVPGRRHRTGGRQWPGGRLAIREARPHGRLMA